MEPALDAWQTIAGRLKDNHVILFLDFDGTLAPIVRQPGRAALPARTRAVLHKLCEKKWCTVVLVSGRSLPDLREKVGIEGLIYAGNHGIEVDGPRLAFVAPVAAAALAALTRTKAAVTPFASGGVILEDKGLSLTIHYRMAEEAAKTAALDAVRLAARPFLDVVDVRAGKEVVEITPRGWDKGKAVGWLLDRITPTLSGRPAVSVYIGDDATDEDAFKALDCRGITVVVAKRAGSCARYCLDNTAGVRRFLQRLLDSRL